MTSGGPVAPADAQRTADNDLLERLDLGDRAAMLELLRRHAPAVLARLSARPHLPWSRSLTPEDVMAVTQTEALVRIHEFRPRNGSSRGASFLAWISIIAEHNLRDAVRTLLKPRRPAKSRACVASPDRAYATLCDSCLARRDASPIDPTTLRETVDHALADLPPDYALAVRACDLDGLTADDAAAAMGRTVGAVIMLRARAHDQIRHRLERRHAAV